MEGSSLQSKSQFASGNRALRTGDYAAAISHYVTAMQTVPDLAKMVVTNLVMTRTKYRNSRNVSKRQRVAVCGWELAHNAAGRVYTLAKLYETFANVEIIGSIFPAYGKELWEPIRSTTLPVHTFLVEDESRFLEQAIQLVAAHPFDIVHLSKPRIPNIFFGILYKLFWDAKVIMDIDDEELTFVDSDLSIRIDDYVEDKCTLPPLKNLDGQEWTQIAVGLANEFDAVTVSNPTLQQRYGGEIIRHVRDERLFRPSPELKRKGRQKLGIPQGKKVVLFFGTPRQHKGLLEVAETIRSLNRNDLLFAIIGDFPDPALKVRLTEMTGVSYLFLGNQPFDNIPEVVSIGDFCVLLQDFHSPMAQFQVPAKLSDALGMGLVVLVSEHLLSIDSAFQNAVIPTTKASLAEVIQDLIVNDRQVPDCNSIACFRSYLTFSSSSWEILSRTIKKKSLTLESLESIRCLLDPLIIHLLLENNTQHWLDHHASRPSHSDYSSPEKYQEVLDRLKLLSFKEQIDVVKESTYFNGGWYLAEYLDVANKNIDPISHYVHNGAREKRDPSELFSTAWYLTNYPEVSKNSINPLIHFIVIGESIGYLPQPPAKPLTPWWSNLLLDRKEVSTQASSAVYDAIKRSANNQLPVAIIIPVYNAPNDVKNCIETLLLHTKKMARIIIIDDASSDHQLHDVLRIYQQVDGVEIYRNERNHGFTATVNRGLKMAGDADVVLLNSDTKVTPGWLRNLRFAAYSGDKVGTATPFSNNAGAYSAPEIGKENPIPEGLSLDNWARVISQTSRRTFPNAPTGHGFCMYIRRDCLDETGFLDENAFPRGYGEENDFCMRASNLGWSHVVDDATYIYHVRSASFGDAKDGLLKQGRATIDRRYPDYTHVVRSFVKQPDLLACHEQISTTLGKLYNSGDSIKPRLLYVLSTRTGGTPQTNQDLMTALGDRIDGFVLWCNSRKIELLYYAKGIYTRLEAHILDMPIRPFPHRSDEYDVVVSSWLVRYAFELVHIRHIAWHSLGLIDLCKSYGLPVVFSFHDFYSICPTVKLLNDKLEFCGGSCTESNGQCQYDLWHNPELPSLNNETIMIWRREFESVLRKCDAFVTTSESARNILVRIYPFLKNELFFVIPHGRDFKSFGSISRHLNPIAPTRLLIPGNLTKAKGGDIISALGKNSVESNIEIHILGKVAGNISLEGNVILHGEYRRDEFAERAHTISPNFGCIFSIWPETHCHTLTELWASGIPVIGFDYGAVGERIRDVGGGWLCEQPNAGSVLNLLDKLYSDASAYGRAVEQISFWQQHVAKRETCYQMGLRYLRLYSFFTAMEG